jgi:hypothetical protein
MSSILPAHRHRHSMCEQFVDIRRIIGAIQVPLTDVHRPNMVETRVWHHCLGRQANSMCKAILSLVSIMTVPALTPVARLALGFVTRRCICTTSRSNVLGRRCCYIALWMHSSSCNSLVSISTTTRLAHPFQLSEYLEATQANIRLVCRPPETHSHSRTAAPLLASVIECHIAVKSISLRHRPPSSGVRLRACIHRLLYASHSLVNASST